MVSAPPDAKLDAGCFVTTNDYRLGVKSGKPDAVKKFKGLLAKAKDFKGYTVEDDNGFVFQTKTEFLVMYSADIGGKPVLCDNTVAKPPKTEEKAREAYAVCKSLAAK